MAYGGPKRMIDGTMRCVAAFTTEAGELAEVLKVGRGKYSIYIGNRDKPAASKLDAEQMMRVIATYTKEAGRKVEEGEVEYESWIDQIGVMTGDWQFWPDMTGCPSPYLIQCDPAHKCGSGSTYWADR